MKDYLTVGELSELFALNVQTLHYYDRIGLFKPKKRRENGYRLYQFDQIYELAGVRFMRRMGYSVDDIFRNRDDRTGAGAIESLRSQASSLRAQIDELMIIEEALLRKASFIEKRTRDLDTDLIVVREFPERYYIPIGEEEQLYYSTPFYFYPTMVFYEGRLKHFAALLDEEDADAAAALATRGNGGQAVIPKILPAGKYLVGWHVGPYERIRETFRRMRESRPELQYDDTIDAVNINLVDQFVEKESGKYITEIQMPIVS